MAHGESVAPSGSHCTTLMSATSGARCKPPVAIVRPSFLETLQGQRQKKYRHQKKPKERCPQGRKWHFVSQEEEMWIGVESSLALRSVEGRGHGNICFYFNNNIYCFTFLHMVVSQLLTPLPLCNVSLLIVLPFQKDLQVERASVYPAKSRSIGIKAGTLGLRHLWMLMLLNAFAFQYTVSSRPLS